MHKWLLKNEISCLQSKWLKLFCEHWLDEQQNLVEYWRVEKDDSLIIVPIQNKHIICTAASFRPGIKQLSIDLPGGRLAAKESKQASIAAILWRELAIPESRIQAINALNKEKWPINSAFSNQGLWAFTAWISPEHNIPEEKIGAIETADQPGVAALLEKIHCLQCRAVLYEWQRQHGK